MAKKLTLNDLTKAELLEILNRYVFSVTDREIIRVRYNSLIQKAGAVKAEALTDLKTQKKKRGKSGPNVKKIVAKKYNRAMRLYTQAQKLKSQEYSGPMSL